MCPTRGCLNPRHYQPVVYMTWREKVGIDRPSGVPPHDWIAEAFDPTVQDAGDADDVYDLITSAVGGSHRSADDLQKQWPIYPLELFEAGLERVRREYAV